MPSADQKKYTILHIGDDIVYNPDYFKDSFFSKFNVVQPSLEDRQRPAFIAALKAKKWGDFHAVFRPFWNSGGEMGKWDQELVPHLPSTCKIFASAGAGYDWADIPTLSSHGVTYCNGARASSEAVADMAIWHILSVFRNLIWSAEAAKSGDVEQFKDAHKNQQDTAFNPRGRSLGIIGLGNIGYTIAQKAWLGFGMKVLYHDIVRKDETAEKAIEGTFYKDLNEMLGVADCVVVATPFFGEKLITADRLKKFKKGSRFVNIARGTLVDEDALVDALKSGQIFAAGLDVHANEPHVHPEFTKMRNVTLTCHNAGGAWDTASGFEKLAMENIEAFLLEGKALTPVNAHLIGKK
jgi:lactate dehydrogenase-like 2-hydroxyacid dehydrogenase